MLGIPPICDFCLFVGKPHLRSQLLPFLCLLPRLARALRAGTPFLSPLSFERPTCLSHGRRSWSLQEALCGGCGRHLHKSAIRKDRKSRLPRVTCGQGGRAADGEDPPLHAPTPGQQVVLQTAGKVPTCSSDPFLNHCPLSTPLPLQPCPTCASSPPCGTPA